MIHYAIGKKVTETPAQGICVEAVHICPISSYEGNLNFHPIFTDKGDAEKYKDAMPTGFLYDVVELHSSGKIKLPSSRSELVEAWRDQANDVFCERLFDKKDSSPLNQDECFEVLIRMIKHYNSGYNGR